MSTRLLAIGLIVLSAITFWGTLGIPASSFEPLGPSAFPRALAILVALFSLALLVRGDEKRPAAPEPGAGASAPDGEERPTPYLALATGAAAVVFVFLMQLRIVNFGILTAGFLMVVITVLTRFNRRALLPTLILSVLLGGGIDYLFTQVFIVDLP